MTQHGLVKCINCGTRLLNPKQYDFCCSAPVLLLKSCLRPENILPFLYQATVAAHVKPITYQITMCTADVRGASTDGNVYIALVGEAGAGQEQLLCRCGNQKTFTGSCTSGADAL